VNSLTCHFVLERPHSPVEGLWIGGGVGTKMLFPLAVGWYQWCVRWFPAPALNIRGVISVIIIFV